MEFILFIFEPDSVRTYILEFYSINMTSTYGVYVFYYISKINDLSRTVGNRENINIIIFAQTDTTARTHTSELIIELIFNTGVQPKGHWFLFKTCGCYG